MLHHANRRLLDNNPVDLSASPRSGPYTTRLNGEEMSNDKRPVLGISVGDPAGIGPEITAKALG